MSGVHVLMMKGLHGSMPYAFILALAQFESLQTLHLSSCRLSNIAHLRRIVASFPKLEELALYGEVLTTQSSGIHVGASALFQPESDIRLRRLTIDARGDARKFKPIIDWVVHARICTSLVELSIGWIGEPTRSIEAVDRLLRVASPSLTRYSEVANLSNWHGNLIPNTVLRSLDCTLTNINPLGQSSDNWPKMVDKLRSILSTVRSRQLEHIGLSSGVMLYDSAYGELGVVVEKLDLRHLHEVMSRPYFDALREIKMKTLLYDSHKRSAADVDDIGRKIEVVFRTLLRPWSDRGIVDVVWTQ
ncbi:uncharacterized protein B0H18DRAFT_1003941 [Fomitopsis serialis]|uniref:uncharacterized protein n=1 Tax=Fomitopsis serialis TaxID=139415 RepID=UPI0020083A8E|nr:uncharacterized protein B0H18DRAFT_1003941 [Neoantrodia serialis]KAH9927297.1 hypothetical protein B0H18DRAFT_1003941 [Neoantrodia serialis]